MKRLIFAAALLAPLTAQAADLPPHLALPTKAAQVGFPIDSGMYWGLAAIGDATKVDAGPVGTAQLQGGAGLVVGYTWPLSGSFAFVEAAGYIQNVNGGDTQGFSFSGPVKFQQTVGFGADGVLQMLAVVFPGAGAKPAFPSVPVLPAGVTVASQHMYVHVTAEQADITSQFTVPTVGNFRDREWLLRFGGGLGIMNRLSNNTMLDVRFTAFADSTEMCLGPFGCPKQGFGAETVVAVKW